MCAKHYIFLGSLWDSNGDSNPGPHGPQSDLMTTQPWNQSTFSEKMTGPDKKQLMKVYHSELTNEKVF